MSIDYALTPLVDVDSSLCVNCHKCISVCPVKYCNDGSGDVVKIIHDSCLGCGTCIDECSHNARFYIDDFKEFINDIIAGKKIIAVVAPSAAASFPNKYLKLNTFLKELGVSAVFDVSFGAELTVKSYVEYIKENNPTTVIAQPCPTIVNYIEIYKPELIKYLAPVDSPVLHTIKMIKSFYSQYSDYKYAFISPCISKKNEFEETETGAYNVTMKSIDKFLEENKIDLEKYTNTEFDNPPAERAVMFSSPGGLTKTLERWIPDVADKVRKIEGVNLIYDYLDKLPEMIQQGKAPLIVDCLNCEFGCNQGPASLAKSQSPDETEFYIKKRYYEQKEKYLAKNSNDISKSKQDIEDEINKFWTKNLYQRTYKNKWQNFRIKYPTKEQIDEIYKKMLKDKTEDIQNCASCGYGTCERMAVAIFNGLNKVENCHLYRQKIAEKNLITAEKNKSKFINLIETAQDGFIEVNNEEIIINSNDAMMQILKKSDIIGRSLFEFIDKKNQKTLQNQLKNRKSGQQSTYELDFTQSDGKKITTLVSASPLYDFETKKQTGSFGFITDITHLKQTEAELREAKENLEQKVKARTAQLSETLEEVNQQKEELTVQAQRMVEIIDELNVQKQTIENEKRKLNDILAILPNPAFIIDENGIVTFWNKAMEQLTGISYKEMIGKGNHEYAKPFYGEARPVLIDFAKMDDEFLKENYKNISKENNLLKTETYVPALRGEKRFLIANACAIYDKSGKYSGAIEIIEDFTDRQRQHEMINQQKEELSVQTVKLEEIIEELNQQKEEINSQKDLIELEREKLDNILEMLPNAAFIIDEHGIVTFWNAAIENLTGIKTKDIIGKGNYEYSIPFYGERRKILIDLASLDDEFLKENYKSIEKTKNILKAESYVPLLKGQERYLHASAAALHDRNGKYLGAIEVIEDFTERQKQQEKIEQQRMELMKTSQKMSETLEELQVSNEIIEQINSDLTKLSIVASETDNAIVIMDKEGNIEWINNAFTRIYGFDLPTLLEKKGKNLLTASDYSEIKEIYEQVIETKLSSTFTSIEQDKDGKKIYSQTTLTPIYNQEEELSNLVSISSDVTDLKLQEELLREYSEEIKAQRDTVIEVSEKIKQIVLTLPDAAFVIDANGVVEYWNAAIEQMTGFEAEKIIGKGNYEYSVAFYGERRPILIDLVRMDDEYIDSNYKEITRKNNIIQAETNTKIKGQEMYLVGTATALYDKEGNYAGAIEIIHDITQRQYHLKEIELQRQNIIESIHYALHIQEALLPSLSTLIDSFSDHSLIFKPRDIVSGDFYWTYQTNGKTIIVVSDCTGHGVPGAMMSMLGISFLSQIVNQMKVLESNIILDKLRQLIIKHLTKDAFGVESKDGMDLALIIFDKQSKTIEFSGANNPIYIVSEVFDVKNQNTEFKRIFELKNNSKKLFELGCDKMPIGQFIKTEPFTKKVLHVNNGDRIFMFTDGFPDLYNYNSNQKFTKGRFKEMLLSTSNLTLSKQKEVIENTYEQWLGGTKQVDDITIVALEI